MKRKKGIGIGPQKSISVNPYYVVHIEEDRILNTEVYSNPTHRSELDSYRLLKHKHQTLNRQAENMPTWRFRGEGEGTEAHQGST